MSTTRLFILGALSRIGPMHGHQIRREAQVSRTESWSNVKPGSLYGALQRMAAEGAIDIVRTEQEGNRPERTVYQITEKGRAEMISLRDAILRDARLKPDPIDLAIQFLNDDLSEDEARVDLAIRKHVLQDQLAAWKVAQIEGDPYLNDMERMVYVHAIRRVELELAWHEELLERLPELLASMPADDF